MLKFAALEWHEVKGRGRVAIVANDRDRARGPAGRGFADLIGPVEIDGQVYCCHAVETYALVSISAGTKIGLYVKGKRPRT